MMAHRADSFSFLLNIKKKKKTTMTEKNDTVETKNNIYLSPHEFQQLIQRNQYATQDKLVKGYCGTLETQEFCSTLLPVHHIVKLHLFLKPGPYSYEEMRALILLFENLYGP